MELGGLITGLIFSSYKPTQMKLLERLEYHFPLMARWRELRARKLGCEQFLAATSRADGDDNTVDTS